jgi:hypothetical protein
MDDIMDFAVEAELFKDEDFFVSTILFVYLKFVTLVCSKYVVH